ncbi:hypothetical protein ACFLIM_32740 [Nonomuraea sp. M3C6]|uniref:Uncharacterized protein n=1 Tax=Nonomuraea marmarensis TaxID=3351344 RepID=A0ABW7AKT1_9ACTN
MTTPPYEVVMNPDGTSPDPARRPRHSYVVVRESQRQVIEKVPGVTCLPFSTAQPAAAHRIILRKMVVEPRPSASH